MFDFLIICILHSFQNVIILRTFSRNLIAVFSPIYSSRNAVLNFILVIHYTVQQISKEAKSVRESPCDSCCNQFLIWQALGNISEGLLYFALEWFLKRSWYYGKVKQSDNLQYMFAYSTVYRIFVLFQNMKRAWIFICKICTWILKKPAQDAIIL
jgi:hypothetical protein